MELFRELAVKIKGLDNAKGTGCIYQLPGGRIYILTAHHCLTDDRYKRSFGDEEQESIEIFDFNGERFNISKVFVPQDISLDFAVIETTSRRTYNSIAIERPNRRMDYTFFGFPHYLKDDDDPGELLDGHVVEVRSDTFLTLQNKNGRLSDEDSDAWENTVGFSGSGIYTEENGSCRLIGILARLRGSGTHGRLVGINIEKINDFLYEEGLELLIPFELIDFKSFLDSLIEDEDDNLKYILRRGFTKYIVGISPRFILEKLKEKIFLPYCSDRDVLDAKLWEGWIRLLLYISLSKGEEINIKNINNYVFLEEPKRSKYRFYFTHEKRIASFVPHLYGKSYSDIQNDDLIFINSEKFKGTKTQTFNEIHQIIQNISSPIIFEYGIDISNPSELKKVKVVHLDHFIDEIENVLLDCLRDRKTITEIEAACINRLNILFKEFETNNTEEVERKIETNS